jgi:hemoglobin-like flavoprotein
MDATKIQLVQSSFEKVVPIADAAAEIFYSKLFEKDPSLKNMFRGDMKEQGKKLMTMIATAVNGLSNLEAIVPAVQDLGRRHAGYGVTDQMYDTVGSSLIETLAAGLGEEFTEEVKSAWIETYVLLSTTMKDAVAEAENAPGLTPFKIKLVQDSFKLVAPIADTAAEIFYSKLFEKDPSLKRMFSGDMKEQGKKLMTMIATAVNGLTDLGKIVPAVQDLGKRHAGYGVTDSMYDTVGAALLETLEAGLGAAFTPPVKSAWTEVYVTLATTMKDAATSAKLTPPSKKWYEFWK